MALPPPPDPTIDRVKVVIKTADNNKEVNGHVFFYVLGTDGKTTPLSTGWHGAEQDWVTGTSGRSR